MKAQDKVLRKAIYFNTIQIPFSNPSSCPFPMAFGMSRRHPTCFSNDVILRLDSRLHGKDRGSPSPTFHVTV